MLDAEAQKRLVAFVEKYGPILFTDQERVYVARIACIHAVLQRWHEARRNETNTTY
jgi:hypothetical protein